MILCENYCDECDEMVHTLVNEKDFYDFKVGRIRCPNCGAIIHPCNECLDENGQHYDCGINCKDCPWYKAKIVKPLTDEEYMRYLKDNEPKMYETYKNGKQGDYYNEIISKLEYEDIEPYVKGMKKKGWSLFQNDKKYVIFKKNEKTKNGFDELRMFKNWKEVEKFIDSNS